MSSSQAAASAREKFIRLHPNGDNVPEWTKTISNRLISKFKLPPFEEIEGHHLVNLGVVDPAKTFGASLVRKMEPESLRPTNLSSFAKAIQRVMEGEGAEAGYYGSDDEREFKFADAFWEDNEVVLEQVTTWASVLFSHAQNAPGDSFRSKILKMSAFQAFDFILTTLPEEMVGRISAKPGDIPTLRTEINLSLSRLDDHTSDDLAMKFLTCTMAGEGKGDLMRYLATKRSYKNRLVRINQEQPNAMSALALLRGLDSVVFRSLIDQEETRSPRCADYDEMEEKIKKWSTTKVGCEALQQAMILKRTSSQ